MILISIYISFSKVKGALKKKKKSSGVSVSGSIGIGAESQHKFKYPTPFPYKLTFLLPHLYNTYYTSQNSSKYRL